MTDQPGRAPEERLPARRPPSEPAPADRFTAPPQAHRAGLTPDRAAQIVRQSGNARWIGFLTTIVVVLFIVIYYFYELIGIPFVTEKPRLAAEIDAQQVTAIERGYNLYEANCARCHGAKGEGGIGPSLNDDMKLYTTPAGVGHLSEEYLRNVLNVGGRYVCGNPESIMPVWLDENGGTLNYREIEELIAFLRAPNTQEYLIRDHTLYEPVIDPATGQPKTFRGWYDPNFRPDPAATPVPACWSRPDGGSTSPPPSVPPDAVTLDVVSVNIAFEQRDLEVPAGQVFAINHRNEDPRGIPHDIDIRTTDGTVLVDVPTIDGGEETTYVYEPLEAGTYEFFCSVHPVAAMTGTLTVR